MTRDLIDTQSKMLGIRWIMVGTYTNINQEEEEEGEIFPIVGGLEQYR